MNKLRLYLLIIAGVGLLLFVFPSRLSQGLRSGTLRILSPVIGFSQSIAVKLHTSTTNLRSLSTLHQERSQLQKRVVELEAQVVALANAALENEVLKKELGITNRPASDETVAASIISRTTNNLLGEVLIDQGANAGLEEDQAVVSQGVLVGRIKEVYKTTAVVSLVNSINTLVQAKLTDSEALGLIKGGPTGLRLIEVDQGVAIKEGEIVQTSGLGGVIPRGLIIGSVDRLISPEEAVKQEAIVRSPINFDQLRVVFVILRTSPE